MNALPNNSVKLTWSHLPALFPGFPASDRWLSLLERHAELIAAAAPRVRVTAVAPDDAVRRQYAESLELWRIVRAYRPAAATLADVGSGGGFPGLVIAAIEPGLEVHLVEPLRKRAALLAEMADALGLANVTVHPLRGEEAGRSPLRDRMEIVTARAVAPLRELLEYTAPLATPGGLLAFPKGSALDGELGGAATAAAALLCVPIGVEVMRPAVAALRVALFEKQGATPERYPRRPGTPAKRPL